MQELIKVVENEPRVSHRVIAENTNNHQKNVNEIIRKYEDDFKQFGILPFQTEKLKDGAGRGQKTYYLNEDQFYLLVTYLRNNVKVREFKVKLIKEFSALRNAQEKSIKHIAGGYKSQLSQKNKRIKEL